MTSQPTIPNVHSIYSKQINECSVHEAFNHHSPFMKLFFSLFTLFLMVGVLLVERKIPRYLHLKAGFHFCTWRTTFGTTGALHLHVCRGEWRKPTGALCRWSSGGRGIVLLGKFQKNIPCDPLRGVAWVATWTFSLLVFVGEGWKMKGRGI